MTRRSNTRTNSFKRLRTHAPMSCAVEVGDGTYFNRPWTLADVGDAINAGMWFAPNGQHNFADRHARKLAMDHYFRLPRDQFGRVLP